MIRTNFNRKVGNALAAGEGTCFTIDGDLKVYIEAVDAASYPDGMVLCEPPKFVNEKQYVISNPTLILEVLSKGTANWDRGGKFRRYEQLPSVQEYVMIEQNEMAVEVYTRNAEGDFVRRIYAEANEMVALRSIGVQIPVHEIYERVNFSEE